jgi:Putative MetA-pathway of phenol degradation
MAASSARRLALAILLGMATSARAQDVGSRVPEGSGSVGDPTTSPPSEGSEPGSRSGDSSSDEKPKTAPAPTNLHEWFLAPFSREADRDGPINTDRPTFTPANTVVPLGRVQFESGFTFNQTTAGPTRSAAYDLPELAVRIGIFDRVEFRTFWTGQTFTQSQVRPGALWSQVAGLSDMEVGFKTQLIKGDPKRLWLPTTALITSVIAPTGGTSYYSSQTVQPYINLIYGWSPTEKLSIGGSTGYLGMRQQALPSSGLKADSFSRFHQSLVAFYTATERATLFYEWYIFTYTSAADNRPQNYMDGGVLYRLSPNIQLDLRAGFGLSGRPDDFFTGAGFSIRF